MRLAAILSLLIITGFGFWACQEYVVGKSVKPSFKIEKPVTKFQKQDSVITFFSELGFEHTFPSGTAIKIPKRSIINSQGEFVEGLVELRFCIYQDALDLFFDGLLMDHSVMTLETAGGFRLELFKQGKPVFLDPTQNIEIHLEGFGKERDHSLYHFNRVSNNWDSILSTLPVVNEDYVQLERAIKRMKPEIQFPLSDQYFTFNYKGILDAIYDQNLTNVNHKRTQEKMKNYGLRWKEIYVEAINVEGFDVDGNAMVWRNVSRKEFPEWTKNKIGKLEKITKNRYRIFIEDKVNDRRFSTQVETVIPLETLFKLGPGYWKKQYESKIVRLENALEERFAFPDSYRSFNIYKLGAYVWQRGLEEENSVRVHANFKAPLRTDLESTGFYFLTENLKTLKYYPKEKWKDFLIYEKSKNYIFAFLPNENMYFLPISRLADINFQQLKKMNNPSFNFELQLAGSMPISKATFIKYFK